MAFFPSGSVLPLHIMYAWESTACFYVHPQHTSVITCPCIIGIMLLEKQLLNNRDAGLGPRPAKRARGASAPLPEGTTAWVELARYTHLEI